MGDRTKGRAVKRHLQEVPKERGGHGKMVTRDKGRFLGHK